jgi:hypothetical protein
MAVTARPKPSGALPVRVTIAATTCHGHHHRHHRAAHQMHQRQLAHRFDQRTAQAGAIKQGSRARRMGTTG